MTIEPDGGVPSYVTVAFANDALPRRSRERADSDFRPSPGESGTITWLVPGNACGVAPTKNGSSETVTASAVPRPEGSLAASVSVAWFTLVRAELVSVAVGGVGPAVSSVMVAVAMEPTLRA